MHKQLQFPFFSKNYELALKCEGKYFLFHVQTGNYETEIYEEYALLCEIEGGLCKVIFSPADISEYGSLTDQTGFELTTEYMKEHNITTVYSTAGIPEIQNNFLGLDLTYKDHDPETGTDAWGIEPIFSDNTSDIKHHLIDENIKIKFLFD